METSAFWDPIERGLRIRIDSASRPELSQAFRRAVHTLGLIEAGVRSGNHLWPILFQAGVVPQLADHIGRFLEGRPPPDYEDEEELSWFALAIRDRIPKAWVRLREILETASGRRACAAILQAHRADDFDLLPPHSRQKMREAFKGVTRQFFATPHLVFQVDAEQVALCLPKQTPKLLTPASHWQVGDTRTFAATETSIVPVEHFNSPTVMVLLKNLAPPVADWSRQLSLFPSDTRPVQVFALPRGKEIRVASKATGNVTLPFGNYAILVGVAAESNIDSRVFIVSDPLVPENSWWSSLVCAAWNNHLGEVQALPEDCIRLEVLSDENLHKSPWEQDVNLDRDARIGIVEYACACPRSRLKRLGSFLCERDQLPISTIAGSSSP
jgi:hypothetical protein